MTNKSVGGLYRNIKMSLKSANIMVISLIALLITVTVLLVANGGFTVSFDSDGGSYVKPVKALYGENINVDEPKRSGWKFKGWYLDRDCTIEWYPETDRVTDSMTLYAGWEKE